MSETCRWLGLPEACRLFAQSTTTQNQRHIVPLHWYLACRLCLEGGFPPDEIKPRPPFIVDRSGRASSNELLLRHEPDSGGLEEQTVLGGLKTKGVDVVVTKPQIGPVIALSVKGALFAFRNLTNRLEEAAGDCTNLHMNYPSLVFGYWALLRANRVDAPVPRDSDGGAAVSRPDDVAIGRDGDVQSRIVQYHLALSGLSGRRGTRNEISTYEALALTLVRNDPGHMGEVFTDFPLTTDPLAFGHFMHAVYRQYDERFVFRAPALAHQTARRGWSAVSPVLGDWRTNDYELRATGEHVADGT